MRRFLLCAFVLISMSVLPKRSEPFSCQYQGNDLDYGAMLHYCSQKLSALESRFVQVQNSSEEFLVPVDEQEENEMICAYAYFLIAIFRMRQEVACANEDESKMVVNAVWHAMDGVFQLFDAEVQKDAIYEVIEWIEDHADDAWSPEENIEAYQSQDQWTLLRKNAADDFLDMLHEILQNL